jgi:ANTAR domain
LTVRLFVDRTLGTINLYATRPGEIPDTMVRHTQEVAAYASVLLASAITEDQLRQAISTRGLIGQAQGILMNTYQIDAASAFEALRRTSQQQNVKLVVVAERLVATGAFPDFTATLDGPKNLAGRRGPSRRSRLHRRLPGTELRIPNGEQMQSAAHLPVESGQSYTINEVDGAQPQSLDDFNGDIHLTLARNGQVLRVTGTGGSAEADSVRFYQKDLTLHDRDIRVWTITRSGGSTFLAAPYAAF